MEAKTNRCHFLMVGWLTALAATQAMGANDLLRIGLIGTGGRMRQLLSAADHAGSFQIVAACDVYAPNLDKVKQRPDNTATFHVEYREVLDNKDVDAVIIAAPDHW